MTNVSVVSAAVAMSLVVAAGCGNPDGLRKVIVSGDVTYAGQPVENGQIYFYPAPGTNGPVSGAPIKDGRYRAAAKDGVPVGEHLVKIEGFRPRPRQAKGGDLISSGATDGAPLQYVPRKYNRETQLQVTIPDGKREHQHDFNLDK